MNAPAPTAELAKRAWKLATAPTIAPSSVYANTLRECAEALRQAASPAACEVQSGDAPEGATHMRRPEYVTAWFYDVTQRWPSWLVDKYTNTEPVSERMIGRYAVAIDGEFWRWFDADKFNEMFVSIPAVAQAAQVPAAWLVKWAMKNSGPQASAYLKEDDARRAAKNVEAYSHATGVEVLPVYTAQPLSAPLPHKLPFHDETMDRLDSLTIRTSPVPSAEGDSHD